MAGVAKQIVFALDPYNGMAGTYEWPNTVEDGNDDESVFTVAYAPPAKETLLTGFQSSVFIGAINASEMLLTFKDELAMDGSDTITAEAITSRVDPSLQGQAQPDAKEFYFIEFIHINPAEEGLDIDYAVEIKDPTRESVSWQDTYFESGQSKVFFPSALARWVHLRIRDTTNTVNENIFGPFNLFFERLFSRDDSETS